MKKRIMRLGFTIIVLTLWSVFSSAQSSPEVEKATRHLANGQFDEVIEELVPWVDSNPDTAAYYILGYALYEKGRHAEAVEMFEAGYLLDPDFSPSSIKGLPWIAEMEARVRMGATRHSRRTAPVVRNSSPAPVVPVAPVVPEETASPEPIAAETVPAEALQAEPQAAVPMEASTQVPAPVVSEPVSPSQPPSPQPQDIQNMSPEQVQELVNDPARMQAMMEQATQGMEQDMPMGFNPMQLMGILQTMGIFVQVFGIVQWIYLALCLFLVARKVGVAGPWLAFIPIVQAYTFVRTAGKPWWWLLVPLLFIPAGFLVMLGPVFILVIFALALAFGAALCMGISENTGRNKWLGLLLMIPLVNLVYWGILAFSKSDSMESFDESVYQAMEEGNPDPFA